MKKINLIIVEDHAFTRQTLVYELKKIEEVNLVGVFSNGKEAVDFSIKSKVDVILMDIEMPVMDGIVATKEIKAFNPDIKVIMLTSHSEKEKVLSSFSSGANGYCVKNIKTQELLEIIKIVDTGGVWFDKQIALYILEVIKNTAEIEVEEVKKDYKITPAERLVLKLVSEGMSNSQIAETLCLSISTVKNHVSNIIKKLAVKDRTQIAISAIKNNLLD